MDKYVLVTKQDNSNEDPEFRRVIHGDDAYTDDIGNAYVFNLHEAEENKSEDEVIAKLQLDEEDCITGIVVM